MPTVGKNFFRNTGDECARFFKPAAVPGTDSLQVLAMVRDPERDGPDGELLENQDGFWHIVFSKWRTKNLRLWKISH